MNALALPLLEASGVAFARRGRPILHAVSAIFHGGEWTAVVGPNGAGKSTLLALLAGLVAPLSGSVRLSGQPIAQWTTPQRATQLTWFGEATSFEGDIAVHEVVRLGRLPHFGLLGAPSVRDEAAVSSALEEAEATSFALRRLGELSDGERQRVLLARAFAADTPVCLYDEPTVHLDAPHQRRLIHSLIAQARAGAAVISVLHDLTLALAADRVIAVAGGRICCDGSPDNASVRNTLTAVFDRAFTIRPLDPGGRLRWAAIPNL